MMTQLIHNRAQASKLFCLSSFAMVCIAVGCGTAPAPAKPTSAATTPASTTTPPLASIESQPADSVPASESGQEVKTEHAAIELLEMDWKQVSELVASHKGKVVVVDVWSTSCEPCLKEFPLLVELKKRHGDQVVCISFDCDFIGAKNKPVAFYRERVLRALTNMHAENIINAICSIESDELFKELDLDSIPAVYVFNQQGKVAKRFDNRTPAGDSEEGISYKTQVNPLVAELLKSGE